LRATGRSASGIPSSRATANKIRRLHNNQVVAGFAGSTADAFSLFGRFESKLEQTHGNLARAAVELAKEWRTDKVLRHLQALLVVSDKKYSFLVSGDGDVIEPDDGVIAIGSGGPYALAAARALIKHSSKSAREIVEESLQIASEICVFTNSKITVEVL
jgi:ATP-dependent HslUV protease, peptidase subunit HslV